jgi:hypothetical protein
VAFELKRKIKKINVSFVFQFDEEENYIENIFLWLWALSWENV